MKDLKNKYELVCNEYVKRFCAKQGIPFEFWVADIVGGVALCSDFYFNFNDIVWDINSNQPKGLIIQWYNYTIDNPNNSVNYYAYTKGVRPIDLSNQPPPPMSNKLTTEAEELMALEMISCPMWNDEEAAFMSGVHFAYSSLMTKAQGLFTREDIEASNAALKETSEMRQHQKDRADALQQHAEKLAEALSVLLNSDNIAFMDAGEYDMALTTLSEYEKSKM